MRHRALLALAVLVAAAPAGVASCAHRPQQHAGEDSRLVISRRELDDVGSISVYDAILRLRAEFFRSRGHTSLATGRSAVLPTVYVDQVRLGGVAELQNIPANQVEQVRLYRAGEATTKYGLGNMGGVIEVTSRR